MKHCALALLLLLGIVSRFLNIDAQGIKIDETWVVPTPNFHFQERSIYPKLFEYQQYKSLSPTLQNILKKIYEIHPLMQIIIIRVVSDVHPPLFFIFNYFWSSMAGYNLWVVRTPAAIYWIISAFFLVFFLLSQKVDRKVTVLSLFMVTISPYYLFLSNYARPYTLVLLLCLISSYLCYQLCTKGFRRFIIFFYIITGLLSLHTHYYALFVLMAHAAFLAFESIKRKSFRVDYKKLLLTYFAIGLFFVPWFIALLLQMKWRYSGIENAGSLQYFNIKAFIELLLYFGPAFSQSTVYSHLNYAATLVQFVLVALGIRYLWKNKNDRLSRFWLFMLFLPLFFGGITNNIKPVFSARNFTIVMIPYYVLFAFGVFSLRGKIVRISSIIGIGSVGLYFILYGLAYGNVKGELALEDWRGVAHLIQARYPAELLPVYVYDSCYRDALYYYIPNKERIKGLEDQDLEKGPKERKFLLVIMNYRLDPDEMKVRSKVPFLSEEKIIIMNLIGKPGGAHIYEVYLK